MAKSKKTKQDDKNIVAVEEALSKSEQFMAQNYFERGDFELALEGDVEYLGFLDIMADFRMTKSANLSRYYAGLSMLHLEEYEEGIDLLKRFRTKDQMLGAMRYGAIGDAYWELGDLQRASRYYRRAYRYKPNSLTTPVYLLKAGLLFEHKGEYDEAIRLYERIRKEYADTNEGRDIEKYIARARASK